MLKELRDMDNRSKLNIPRVVLIAHDECKRDMVEWCKFNEGTLSKCFLYATGTTGSRIEVETSLDINLLLSGPRGGDAQVGAMVSQGQVDYLFFFWDALSSHPHDVDVKMLLRLAVLYNVPTACNRSSADFIISSPLFFGNEKALLN